MNRKVFNTLQLLSRGKRKTSIAYNKCKCRCRAHPLIETGIFYSAQRVVLPHERCHTDYQIPCMMYVYLLQLYSVIFTHLRILLILSMC